MLKFNNILKILSLGIGLAIGCILIAKVCFESSYDNFYKGLDISDKTELFTQGRS